MSTPSISVRFWGVRGSIPRPGPQTVRYGGNTSCVEIRCGERVVIFDAGSGLWSLGQALRREGKIGDTDIFLSHGHMDHVIGLPFFAPLLRNGDRLHLWAANFQSIGGVKSVLATLMSFPLFPIELGMLSGTLDFTDFRSGATLEPHPAVRLRTAPLRHPGGAVGYRLEYGGKSIAYLTDSENGSERGDGLPEPGMRALADAADLVIVDATYTDDELPAHSNWGHSSWQQGVRLAEAAGAKRLCLFHHDPSHDDTRMDEIAAAAEAARPGTFVAREGLRIDL